MVGQRDAKRAVAIALRNRWRRQRVTGELRDEIAPKNIIMIGPTGVGKTEIARRLAKLAQAPFLKVEASKFTEVGYVGRDVESIVRDLAELAVQLVSEEEKRERDGPARASAPRSACSTRCGHASRDARRGHRGARLREKLRRMLRDRRARRSRGRGRAPQGPPPTLSVFTPQGVEEMGAQLQQLLRRTCSAARRRSGG